MHQRTLLIIKPDAVFRGLSGEIISRIEKTGFKLIAMKLINVSKEQAAKHYEEHFGRDYYDRLINFILSGPSIAMVVEGPYVIKRMRKMAGKTLAEEREPGSIRGDMSVNNLFNLLHSSDSTESAEREIAIFFDEDEILEYETAADRHWYWAGQLSSK